MRIIKLSREVFGFDSLEGCKAYFNHIVPWQKNTFNIVGEGSHIDKNKINEDELVLFSYDKKIIGIAKIERFNIDNNKVVSLMLKENTLKVFGETPDLAALERELKLKGYDRRIVRAQGWNIIPGDYERFVVDYLMNHEWKEYIS